MEIPNRRLSAERGKRRQRTPPSALIRQVKKEPNELKRKMLLVGYLSDELSKRGAFVFLVGGQAVETYTAGQFTTGDIDITTTDQEATQRLLTRLGFRREGMIWLNEKLAIAVHIVGSYPTGTEKVRTVEVGPYRVRVVGLEELIIDRLRAAKFRTSGRDAEQALVLFSGFRKRIDLDYLRRRAKEEKVDDILPEAKMMDR